MKQECSFSVVVMLNESTEEDMKDKKVRHHGTEMMH
jgi:hypothetical protein